MTIFILRAVLKNWAIFWKKYFFEIFWFFNKNKNWAAKQKIQKGLRNFFLKTYLNMSLVDIHVVDLFRIRSRQGDNRGFVFLGPVFKRVDLEMADF